MPAVDLRLATVITTGAPPKEGLGRSVFQQFRQLREGRKWHLSQPARKHAQDSESNLSNRRND
jgi:hypothetical protein